jgi:hypothetical protein
MKRARLRAASAAAIGTSVARLVTALVPALVNAERASRRPHNFRRSMPAGSLHVGPVGTECTNCAGSERAVAVARRTTVNCRCAIHKFQKFPYMSTFWPQSGRSDVIEIFRFRLSSSEAVEFAHDSPEQLRRHADLRSTSEGEWFCVVCGFGWDRTIVETKHGQLWKETFYYPLDDDGFVNRPDHLSQSTAERKAANQAQYQARQTKFDEPICEGARKETR